MRRGEAGADQAAIDAERDGEGRARDAEAGADWIADAVPLYNAAERAQDRERAARLRLIGGRRGR
jgi:hypothetical protein